MAARSPAVKVALLVRQDSILLDRRRFRRETAEAAKLAGLTGEVSVAVLDDAEVRELNRRYLGHDHETDVLAFPLDPPEVAVSAERAVAEAAKRKVEPLAELMLYVVHGLLHIAGHDDHEPAAARRMHEASLKVLRSLGYRNKIAAPR
ncbi:MAG: rRNA maturation RNase YbeY [Planctomycetes bacterium]|jgi:probable rRNA maturation factor|nr:rRNA maturation RNase YbeY [Planctomycetota bacterium]